MLLIQRNSPAYSLLTNCTLAVACFYFFVIIFFHVSEQCLVYILIVVLGVLWLWNNNRSYWTMIQVQGKLVTIGTTRFITTTTRTYSLADLSSTLIQHESLLTRFSILHLFYDNTCICQIKATDELTLLKIKQIWFMTPRKA